MGKFNLADLVAEGKVPDLGTTAREQIEYIDIDLIDDDPNNFYTLSNVDELAANIELFGLQQPVRVRPNPEDAGRVIIVSGHRRRAAIRKLVDEGRDDLRAIPCIRERGEGSAALQELRLIYANSDTRKLTSSEISKQAERVEVLLYQLKEEGYEFPGRMRDHVAEACKVSKTKLANLKTIRDNLTPRWRRLWEKNKINESLALTVARMPAEHQDLCYESKAIYDDKHYGYYESQAKADGERLARLDKLQCPMTNGPCKNKARKWEHLRMVSSWSCESCSGKCCGECDDLGSCTKACSMFADKIKELKAARREEKRQEKLAQEAKDLPKIRRIQELWLRFGVARESAGKSVQQVCKAMHRYYDASGTDQTFREMEDNTAREDPNANLPYGNCFYLRNAEDLIAAADLLGVSLDYLLCRTDNPKGFAAPPATAAPPAEGWVPLQWLPGKEPPAVDGQFAAARFTAPGSDMRIRTIAYWRAGHWCFPSGSTIDAECVGWFPLPADSGEVG